MTHWGYGRGKFLLHAANEGFPRDVSEMAFSSGNTSCMTEQLQVPALHPVQTNWTV